MNPPDVFATFLDDVASSLDEPGTTGRDLANRGHTCPGSTSTG